MSYDEQSLANTNGGDAEFTIYQPQKDPEQPRTLIGTVISYRTVTTDYGDCLAVEIEQDRTRVRFSKLVVEKALRSGFARERPMPGDRIRLSYDGMKVSESGQYAGKDYHVWRVAVQRGIQAPDWDKFELGEVALVDAAPQQIALDAEVVDDDPLELTEGVADVGDIPF
jgi:hypothetical protein